MVQHVRKIALEVIRYTIANIYVNISPTSLNLQSPAVTFSAGNTATSVIHCHAYFLYMNLDGA